MRASPMPWLLKQWPYAGIMTAVFLLALAPFMSTLGLPLLLIYLQLPAYMIHQFEEHDGDRFRLFANQVIGHGREAFTPLAVFLINSIGVWLVDLVALYLAFTVNLACGLIAIYLPIFNAFTHIAVAGALRRYNPGLWTSLLLFLPFGIWSAIVVGRASHATLGTHLMALGVAILVYAAIMIHIRLRLRKLGASN